MPQSPALAASNAVTADLIAVLAAVTDGAPAVLTTDDGRSLPSGPFESGHRSLQLGLRAWVEEQTHHPVSYTHLTLPTKA